MPIQPEQTVVFIAWPDDRPMPSIRTLATIEDNARVEFGVPVEIDIGASSPAELAFRIAGYTNEDAAYTRIAGLIAGATGD